MSVQVSVDDTKRMQEFEYGDSWSDGKHRKYSQCDTAGHTDKCLVSHAQPSSQGFMINIYS